MSIHAEIARVQSQIESLTNEIKLRSELINRTCTKEDGVFTRTKIIDLIQHRDNLEQKLESLKSRL